MQVKPLMGRDKDAKGPTRAMHGRRRWRMRR
jgi:hypothetical protein